MRRGGLRAATVAVSSAQRPLQLPLKWLLPLLVKWLLPLLVKWPLSLPLQ